MNKTELENSMRNSEQVLINNGSYAGQNGYVTWVGNNFARITPVHDDPLLSIECQHVDLELLEK